jgi:hypothetical protein
VVRNCPTAFTGNGSLFVGDWDASVSGKYGSLHLQDDLKSLNRFFAF